MKSLLAVRRYIHDWLRGARAIGVLGVGSCLRGDDAAGVYACQMLESALKRRRTGIAVKLFAAGTAPENVTGDIRKFAPSHLLIIDAAEVGDTAGAVGLLNIADIAAGGFSTHRMPLSLLIDYLAETVSCDIIVIGVRPRIVSLGACMSPQVQRSCRALAGIITECVTELFSSRRQPERERIMFDGGEYENSRIDRRQLSSP